METRIENAMIDGTMLGREDHGIMTAMIYLSGDGWGCGFGGYALDQWSEHERRRIGAAYGIDFIASCLETVGVEKWEDLKGKHVRCETEGLGGRTLRIGHITKNKLVAPLPTQEPT